MTQLMQSILERLAQLPEPIQNRLARHFLKALEEAEAQTEQQPHQRIAGLALERHGLVAALTRLPKRQREVVVLRYLADLPEQEVAEQLGTSVGSVKQHAHRATARLRRDLAGTGLEREVVPDVRALR